MIDEKIFFYQVRENIFGGSLSAGQVDGMTRILNEWTKRGLTDMRWLAYMLVTTYHETAHTMQPIRELGGEAYLKRKKYYPWVGEGLVQVTWKANHMKFGATAPGQLMTWPLCLKPLFDGMIGGMFTGKKLADYFNSSGANFIDNPNGARKIINGTDKAPLIAGYHRKFMDALVVAATDKPAIAPTPIPATPQPEAPPSPVAPKPMGLLAALIALILSIFKRK